MTSIPPLNLQHHPRLPQHVAIIMDGNGRWAKAHQVPTIAGHKAGADVARAIVERAHGLGIQYLTLYTFSTENWKRNPSWIQEMMEFLRYYLNEEAQDLIQNNVRVKIIGDTSKFPGDLQELLQKLEEESAHNTGLTLMIALGYGARDEIVRAVQKMLQAGEGEVTEAIFASYLDTKGIPDPDVLIRTSGEKRTSNFLLWQLAYAELIFVEDYWPDFTPQKFDQALEEYLKRERRYGN